jgi:hypothetical protein
MITGEVSGHEARIQLKILGPRGQEKEIEAVVDTGYTASLSLTTALIMELGLFWQGIGRGVLADGSECVFDGTRPKWYGTAKCVEFW